MPKTNSAKPIVFAILACGVLGGFFAFLVSSSKPDFTKNDLSFRQYSTQTSSTIGVAQTPIGDAPSERPWITHVEIADLDQDGLLDVIACDAESNSIRWLKQYPINTYTEIQIGANVLAPAHASTCDIDRDGDLDILVASMGQLMPTNDQIGAVVILENNGAQNFTNRTLIDNVARVTDVRGEDLDQDGDIDLAVGQFGYSQGEIRWMRNEGNWNFTSEKLLGLSGTIHTPIGDLDGDGLPDIAALVSQEWEEVHLFKNQGGSFASSVIWGSTNEDYGSSSLSLEDLDQDGDLDILYANGDAFDYAHPGSRPWHGVQWLENENGTFQFHRIGNFSGAYNPVTIDLNADGYLDILAVSDFNDWNNPNAISIMAWVNNGDQTFTPTPLAKKPTHLVALATADMDGDGKPEFVTGGLHAYPPFGTISRLTLWKLK